MLQKFVRQIFKLDIAEKSAEKILAVFCVKRCPLHQRLHSGFVEARLERNNEKKHWSRKFMRACSTKTLTLQRPKSGRKRHVLANSRTSPPTHSRANQLAHSRKNTPTQYTRKHVKIFMSFGGSDSRSNAYWQSDLHLSTEEMPSNVLFLRCANAQCHQTIRAVQSKFGKKHSIDILT